MLTIDSDNVKSVGIHFSYVQDPKIRIFNLYDNQANDLINQLNGSIELIKLERLKIDPKVLSENDCA